MYNLYKWKINPKSETNCLRNACYLRSVFNFKKNTTFICMYYIFSFLSPPEGGRLHDMKVKCSCAFVRSFYERLVNLTLFLCNIAYSERERERACGWTIPIVQKNEKVKMDDWDKSDCVSFNLNHFKYKTIGWCSEHFYMSVSGFIYVLPTPDLFYFKYFLFRKTNSLWPFLFGFVLPLCSFFSCSYEIFFYIKKVKVHHLKLQYGWKY